MSGESNEHRKATAGRIREALRSEFPDSRISVRIKPHAVITVEWKGGPQVEEVSAVARQHDAVVDGRGQQVGWATIRTTRHMTGEEHAAWTREQAKRSNKRAERREAIERYDAALDEVLAELFDLPDAPESAERREVLERRMTELCELLEPLEQEERAEEAASRRDPTNHMVRS